MALTTAQIQQAYVTFFSRPADPVGLAYWQAYSGSVADLYATFAQQTEYSAAFSGLTSAQKVNVVYQNLFGRDAEASGLLYWAGQVEAGKISVANLALAVSAGSQGTDKVTVDSRVSAATAFTAALDTNAEILGYTGATANTAAKTWLAGVTTAANLATAVAAVDTAAAGVVAVGGAAGSTFTLTTGIDSLTGTGGNDKFNADNTGTNTTSGSDVIDGGAGTDTLTVYGFATADGVPVMTSIEKVVLEASAAGATISFANNTSITGVTVQNAVGATDTTVAAGVTVTLATNADAATAQVVDFGATATSGSLVLNAVTTNTTVDVEAQGAAVTTLNIATTGAKSTVGQLEVDAAMATVNITGAVDLTITDKIEEAVEVVNASAFTGKLNIKLADQATAPDATATGGSVDLVDITVTGGSGNDTIDITDEDDDVEVSVNAGAGADTVVIVKTATQAYTKATSTNAGDSIVGGDGVDTLSVDGALSADLTGVVSGFEKLQLTAATTIDMDANKLGITDFIVDADSTLNNLGANTSVLIGATGVDVTATLLASGTADTLTVTLESNTTTGSDVIANSHDVLNIVSSKATADAATVVNELESSSSATSAAALNISGTQDLVIQSIALKAAAAVTNTSTGKLTSTYSTSVKTYTGSAAADVLTVVAGDLKQGNTFNGGAGTDSLSVTASSAQDMGAIAASGFETINLTSNAAATDAVVADFRNVTGLTTLKLVGGDATDTFTLNRLSADTTVKIGSDTGAIATTLNAGTTQKISFAGNYTVASFAADTTTTSLTITADDGDATASEAGGVFTSLTGSSVATITVLGDDELTLGTLGTSMTSVDASAAKGTLTVTASATATSIIGSQDADAITGGAAADTIKGGKGNDTLSGAAGADIYVFEATGALNGSDTLTIIPGAGGDKLNFAAFMSAGSVDQNGGTGTNIVAYTSANTGDVVITNKVVLYSDATNGSVDGASEIAALIEGAGDAFALASGGKAIMITGDAGGANDELRIFFIDDSLDGVLGTVGTADVVLVGIDSDNSFDLDLFNTSNFLFA